MRECEKDVKDGWLGRNAIVGHDDYEHEHEHEHASAEHEHEHELDEEQVFS